MITGNILTTIILGFTCGLSPGPIILLSFSEILRSPKEGLKNGGMYLAVAGLTEFCIGLFLIATASYFQIPTFLLHILSLFGAGLLLFIAYQIFQIRTIQCDTNIPKKTIGIWKIALFVLLNGPLWLFWISVCLPIAFQLGTSVYGGAYLFICIFEISMMIGLACIIFGFHTFRSFLSQESIVHKIFVFLGILLILMAGKILYTELSLILQRYI